MGLIAFLIVVIVVGLLVWAALKWIPMPPQFQTALPIFAIAILVIYLLVYMFGGIADIPIPRVR